LHNLKEQLRRSHSTAEAAVKKQNSSRRGQHKRQYAIWGASEKPPFRRPSQLIAIAASGLHWLWLGFFRGSLGHKPKQGPTNFAKLYDRSRSGRM
jgi:hypothetical protein